MSAADDLELTPEMVDALTYAAVAVVVGPDPDGAPNQLLAHAFQIVPRGGRTRRLVPAAYVADALRRTADAIAADGGPL
ncbi:hypothetical protein [Nocardia farcinica]|uniref:hypothetical protein n=1 Tax=Nocardia farcinica TaxID=37329 RepID=UPI00245687BD|nr:hypothetical protein [Nocardia farcinica]